MLAEQTPEDRRDSESWSEDESEDSSSSSSDTSLDLPLEVSPQDSNVSKKPAGNQMKTKGEIGLEDLPPIENLVISVDENEVKEIGIVYAIIEKLVVVRSYKDERPLDIDSVLFLSPQKPLGKVFDVFGPIAEPFYSVRFNRPEDIREKEVSVDAPVFFAPSRPEPITRYVFLEQLQSQKGSDASWKDNNEPPDELLDYSDDEQERLARRRRKDHRNLRNLPENQGDSEVSVSPPSEPVSASTATPSYTRDHRAGMNKMASALQSEHWRPMHQPPQVNRPLLFIPDVQRPPPAYGFPPRNVVVPPQGMRSMGPSPRPQNLNAASVGHHPMNGPSVSHHPMNSVTVGHHPMNSGSSGHHPINNSFVSHHPISNASVGHHPKNDGLLGHHAMNNASVSHHPMNSVSVGHHPMNDGLLGRHPMNDGLLGHHPMNQASVGHPPMNDGLLGHHPMNNVSLGHHPINRGAVSVRPPGQNPPSFDQLCRNSRQVSQFGLNNLVGAQPSLAYVVQQRPPSQMNIQQGYRVGPSLLQGPRGLAWPQQSLVPNYFACPSPAPSPLPPSSPLSIQIPGSSGAPSPALGPFSFQLLPRPSPLFFNQAAFYKN